MTALRFFGWRAAVATASTAAVALLAACGGGGGDIAATAAAATESAASYTQGPISGFGSVIVGGVRFDDSAAAVADEDGNALERGALKLGMQVEVDASKVERPSAAAGAASAPATAVATRIRFGSEIVGPVGSVDVAASTLQLLGQTVLVTSSTVFDESLSGGLAGLAIGSVLEVHGILDPANRRVVATRIEPKAGVTSYRLRGVVSSLDGTAKTFRIGSELISYAGLAAASVPPPALAKLANGQVVRVVLATTQTAGAWVATRLNTGLRMPEARREASVEGVISAFTSSASFQLNGLAVDASGAAFPDGTAGIVLGARVEVAGTVANGVLVATKVEIEERRVGEAGKHPLELHGEIGPVNTAAKTFALRGVTVWYGGTVAYKGGAEADIAAGRRVEVHGVLSADHMRVEAQRIGFK